MRGVRSGRKDQQANSVVHEVRKNEARESRHRQEAGLSFQNVAESHSDEEEHVRQDENQNDSVREKRVQHSDLQMAKVPKRILALFIVFVNISKNE